MATDLEPWLAAGQLIATIGFIGYLAVWYVHRQPANPTDESHAREAALACAGIFWLGTLFQAVGLILSRPQLGPTILFAICAITVATVTIADIWRKPRAT